MKRRAFVGFAGTAIISGIAGIATASNSFSDTQSNDPPNQEAIWDYDPIHEELEFAVGTANSALASDVTDLKEEQYLGRITEASVTQDEETIKLLVETPQLKDSLHSELTPIIIGITTGIKTRSNLADTILSAFEITVSSRNADETFRFDIKTDWLNAHLNGNKTFAYILDNALYTVRTVSY